MIFSINYADKKYSKARKFNTKTAYSKGKVDNVFEYSPINIEVDFIERNKTILSYSRGNGLWLWKPYIINDALRKISFNDFLIYSDAGSFFVHDVRALINTMNSDHVDIMVFELPLLERQFTKKESFDLLGFDDYSRNQILASYIIIRKSVKSIEFVSEWLEFMCDERIVSNKYFLSDVNEFPDFVAHREDQSVLSILCHKHGIVPYRDPSQFGDRPWEYASNKWLFRPRDYENSPYPRIFVSNRDADPQIYKRKEFVKTLLNRLGLWTKKRYFKKYNIQSEI
jgi:hypothetical protein